MLKFKNVGAQGELEITRAGVSFINERTGLMVTRLASIPKVIGEPIKPVGGKLIVGHSETGHHHVVDADCATLTRVDPFTAFLNVRKATRLVHQREFDTHPPIELQPGMYEFRTGREFDPFEEAIRISAD